MGSPRGFQKLISFLPRDLSVLDVGSGGLQGENTTEFLVGHFGVKNVLGICRTDHEVGVYQAQRGEKKLPPVNIISGDFYEQKFDRKFDLVVLDMNIESNLERDWSDEGLELMRDLVNDGGYLINYVMMTHLYGDPAVTPFFIKDRWKEWWGTEDLKLKDVGERLQKVKGWETFAYDLEERRRYILWVMLKKTNGS